MASLDVIRRLTIQAKTEGVSESTSSLKDFSAAQEGVASSSAKQERATLSLDKAVAGLQRRYDQEFRAQQDLARVQKTLDGARAQGLITQDRQNQLMSLAIRQHNSSGQAISAHAKAMQELQTHATAAASRLGSLGAILGALGPAGLAAGAALGALAIGFKQAADAALSMGARAGALRDMNETVGLSVESLQALQIAAGRTGVSSEQLTTGIEKFSASLSEIRTQSGAAFEALERINPALARQAATAETVEDAFAAISEALREASKEDANFAAKTIFGKGGIGMVRVINEMTGGLENFTQEVRNSIVITDEMSQKWDDLSDSITANMTLAKELLESVVTEAMLEILEKASEAFLEMSRAIAAVDWDSVVSGISKTVSALTALVPMLRAVTTLWSMMPSASAISEGITGATGAPVGLPGIIVPPSATGSASGLPNAAALEKEFAARSKATKAIKEHTKAALTDAEVLRNNVAALGDAATASEKYEAKVAELAQKLQEGTISQDTFNRAVRNLNPTVQQVQGVVTSLGEAMAQAFINGKNGADALNASLKSIASTAASAAINNLIKGDFASAAVSGAISVGSFLASKLFGSSGEDDAKIQERAEQANQELKGLMTNLEGLTKQFNKLAEVSGGELLDALASAQNQFEEIQRAAIAQSTLAAQDLGVPAEVGNLAAQQAAEALSSALQTLAVIRQREIDKFRATLRGADPIAEVTQEFRSLNSIASQLVIALQQAGASAEVAAEAIGQDLATGLNRLRTNFVDVLVRQLREIEGKGFLNQMADLIKSTEDQRIVAATVGGIDTTLIDAFFIKSAQSIVNQAKLTGAAFEELLQVFPRLRTNVLEFVDSEKAATDAAKALEDAAKAAADAAEAAAAAAEAAAQRAEALMDRLFSALTDTTTLEGQLAAFDRAAMRERLEEIKLGGQNLILLETVLAAERIKVINDFNQQAIEAEQRAAEERMNAINSTAKQIVDFVSGLFAGPQSVLSPMAQLQQASANYSAVLAQAQTGNIEAQQQITQTAGTFVDALKAVYGSTQVYQQGVQQVATDLLNLPAAQEATDPVVQALRESIAELQNITLNTGSTASSTAGTVSVVQSVEAQQAQANQTATAQYDQTTLMLHALHLQNTQIQYDQINTNAIINALDQIYANINTTNALLNNVIVAEYAATPGARGGLVTGGAVGQDSVPLLTMPGEYLVNAKATQRWAPLLRSMNDNGSLGELPQTMMGGDSSTLAAEIRSLRADLARGFVANAEYVREGLDEVSDSISAMTRESALRGQAA